MARIRQSRPDSGLGLQVKDRHSLPTSAIEGENRFRAKIEQLKKVEGLLSENQGQNPVVTALDVPSSLNSGSNPRSPPCFAFDVEQMWHVQDSRRRANMARIRQSRPDLSHSSHSSR